MAIENEPSTLRGGQELSLFQVCKGLAERGHRITLLYVKDGDLLPGYRKFCADAINVSGYSLDRKSLLRSGKNFMADLIKLSRWRGSIIYSNQYHDSLFAAVLSFVVGAPFVCQLRLRPPGSFCGQWKIGLKGIRAFIAISRVTRSEWIEAGIRSDLIDVVHNGIDTDRYQPAADRGKLRQNWGYSAADIVVTYVGRIDRDKGLETLIQSMRWIDGCKVKLMVVGKPHNHATSQEGIAYAESLSRLVRELELADQVRFVGHVPQPVELYQLSDLTVLPTVVSEAFGRVIIESMACGTPVVASRLGGIPEILTGDFERGLFTPGDDKDLAAAVSRMIRWKAESPDVGKRCREHVVGNFNENRMLDGIEAVLCKTAAYQGASQGTRI